MGSETKIVSDSEFEATVLKAELPTLLDFWAEWCAPCRAIAPAVDAIATQYKGRLQVVKMDIDANQDTPSRYAVRAIPTLLIFKDGHVVDQLVGLVSPAKLDEMVKRHLT